MAPLRFLIGLDQTRRKRAVQIVDLAIEMLDDKELRNELRAKMAQVLANCREDNGTWNDRQFPRSAGYGTAMALMALHMRRLPRPHSWRPGDQQPTKSKAGK